MLAVMQNLIYLRYDWGNRDFEETIEGAGHRYLPRSDYSINMRIINISI